MEVGRGAGKVTKGVVTNRICHVISIALKLMQGLQMKRTIMPRARDRRTESCKSIFVARRTRIVRTNTETSKRTARRPSSVRRA